MGKKDDNLDALFQGTTAPYNASAPAYGAMPQQVNFPAFMPGQQEGIAQQLSQGYGASPQSYMEQMNALYKPVGMTQLSEPLTQTMRAWGLKPNGQPGGVEGSITGGYQQYGMQTGSPWLDQMFGLRAAMGNAPAGGAVVDPGFPDPKKKKTKTPSPVGGAVAPAPVQYQPPAMGMGDHQTGGIW